MGSNREMSNIAIEILEGRPFLKGYQKLFRILMVAIIFIRQGQYWQIAYQKFLVAQNCMKKV